MAATRLLFGCGYLGSRVASRWGASGDDTVAFTRREHPTPEMVEARTITRQADVTRPETLKWLAAAPEVGGTPQEALLYAVGYDRSAGSDIHSVYAGGLQNVLAALPSSVNRVVYISTTGVYGSADGEWVDESTPTDPRREGGVASLAAEEVLRGHPLGKRSVILRLAGIYGPGRVPNSATLQAGEPLAVPARGWLNLIHVDDAARIVVAADRWAADRANSDGPHVFCVSDGSPVERRDYYVEAARLLGAPTPRFIEPDPRLPATARAASDRRVRNEKLQRELGVTLGYPSYREGLGAILG